MREDPEAAAKAKGRGCKLHCTPDIYPAHQSSQAELIASRKN